ncbi:MAG TPA: alkaline phosphatase family protein [Allosphingosinicella sp.]|nr:alkaline phosphatase family protein [Allosphingosinicella sp.]
MKIARLAALIALPLAAAAQAADPPKLVVVISVDQFSADLFTQYRQHFDGGLERLSRGAVFPAGYQSHAATETCPGHSTILTGSRPARTGIIANNWYGFRARPSHPNLYCAEDERVPGSTHRKYTASTYHLRVPALGDHMKRADPRSRVAVASGKDRSAMMMGGYGPDERWWWEGDKFINPGAARRPEALDEVNRDIAAALAEPRAARDLPGLCEPRSRSIAIQDSTKSVGEYRFARPAGDSNAFKISPDLDQATIDLAAGLRREMKLGEGPATDLLILGLSATDYVGHSYGTEGAEMCIQLMALDKALGEFFRKLDQTGIDYSVLLTADHGGHDIPERYREQAITDAIRADAALDIEKMGPAIGKKLGLSGPILFGEYVSGDMYIDPKLTAAQRARVLREAVRAYGAHPNVARVITRADLLAAPRPSGPPDTWSLLDRAKASFDPERSGDFVVFLKPRVTPIYNAGGSYVATHGSPWDYDRRVPILYWRKGIVPFEQPLAVETVDILPTLAATIGVAIPPGSIDGKCLDLDEGPANSCR